MPWAEQPYVIHPEATTAALDDVHALLDRVWSDHPEVQELDRILVGTAVAEIAGNIIEHGSPAELTLEVVVLDDRVEAHFRDDGLAVDDGVVDRDMPDGDAEGGRGVALARAALDRLVYEREDGRNHWTLVRTLARAG